MQLLNTVCDLRAKFHSQLKSFASYRKYKTEAKVNTERKKIKRNTYLAPWPSCNSAARSGPSALSPSSRQGGRVRAPWPVGARPSLCRAAGGDKSKPRDPLALPGNPRPFPSLPLLNSRSGHTLVSSRRRTVIVPVATGHLSPPRRV